MSEMIDRLATTLHDAMCKQDIDGYLRADIDCNELARAAIEAMREPTEAMEQAYYAACDVNRMCLWKHGYRVMIDAATAPSLPSQNGETP